MNATFVRGTPLAKTFVDDLMVTRERTDTMDAVGTRDAQAHARRRPEARVASLPRVLKASFVVR